MSFEVKNFKLDLVTGLRLDEKGYIDPVIVEIKIDFG
jgi:hypothetical protein